MKLTIASGRNQLPFTSTNITLAAGGTTTSRTLYFTIQGENYLGLNLPSAVVGPISIGIGQKVSITPPDRLAAEKWINYVVSASASNDPETFVQLGKIPAFTVGGQINTQPLVLNTDAAFGLSVSVPTVADLPASGVNGMMRGVLASGVAYEYNSFTQAWVKSDRLFNTYIADINKIGGCAQDIRYLSDFTPPNYLDDGSRGTAISLWMINDTASPESAGKRLGMVVKLNEEVKTNYFDKKLWLVFRGYVNTVTNTIRTKDSSQNNFDYIDQEIPFDANKPTLVLQDALLPGEAFALDVYPRFNLNLVSGTQVKIYPFFYEEAGEYSESGEIFGDIIYNSGDRCVAVPGTGLNVLVLSGKGMVRSFSFQAKEETTLYGLKANTPMQAVAIDGNGTSRLITATLALQESEAIRAYVSTVDGVGFPNGWSVSYFAVANSTLAVTCNYPVQNSLGKIRDDYPDSKIAGNSKAIFSPTNAVIYVKRLSDNQIRSFELNAVVPGASQTFTISNWTSGNIITALPVPASLDFGLFSAMSATLSSGVGTGNITAGYYQVAYAFGYKNTVTSISHDEALGCVLTFSGSFTTTITRSAYWAEPVANLTQLKQVTASQRSTGQQRSILSSPDVFRFDSTNVEAESNIVIRPSDVPVTSPGRWIAVRDPKIPFLELYRQVQPPEATENKSILYLSALSELLLEEYYYGNRYRSTLSLLEKSQVFKQGQAVEPATVSSDSGWVYISMKSSNRFNVLMTNNAELDVSDKTPGYAFELKIKQSDSGDTTLSFPDYCKFVNGIKPFISPEPGKVDILSCVCFEEDILHCALAKDFS